MPFNREELAEMTATREEYVDNEGIAKRLGVSNRTVERLIERYEKSVRIHKVWYGSVLLYRWCDVLECAKIHAEITKEYVPSKRLFTQQQHLQKLKDGNEYLKDVIEQLEDKNEQLKNRAKQLINEIEILRDENDELQNRLVPF
jgi:regulator of replication initiation timing